MVNLIHDGACHALHGHHDHRETVGDTPSASSLSATVHGFHYLRGRWVAIPSHVILHIPIHASHVVHTAVSSKPTNGSHGHDDHHDHENDERATAAVATSSKALSWVRWTVQRKVLETLVDTLVAMDPSTVTLATMTDLALMCYRRAEFRWYTRIIRRVLAAFDRADATSVAITDWVLLLCGVSWLCTLRGELVRRQGHEAPATAGDAQTSASGAHAWLLALWSDEDANFFDRQVTRVVSDVQNRADVVGYGEMVVLIGFQRLRVLCGGAGPTALSVLGHPDLAGDGAVGRGVTLFRNGLSVSHGLVYAALGCGLCALRMGHVAGAVQIVACVRALPKGAPLPLRQALAVALLLAGEYDMAMDAFARVLVLVNTARDQDGAKNSVLQLLGGAACVERVGQAKGESSASWRSVAGSATALNDAWHHALVGTCLCLRRQGKRDLAVRIAVYVVKSGYVGAGANIAYMCVAEDAFEAFLLGGAAAYLERSLALAHKALACTDTASSWMLADIAIHIGRVYHTRALLNPANGVEKKAKRGDYYLARKMYQYAVHLSSKSEAALRLEQQQQQRGMLRRTRMCEHYAYPLARYLLSLMVDDSGRKRELLDLCSKEAPDDFDIMWQLGRVRLRQCKEDVVGRRGGSANISSVLYAVKLLKRAHKLVEGEENKAANAVDGGDKPQSAGNDGDQQHKQGDGKEHDTRISAASVPVSFWMDMYQAYSLAAAEDEAHRWQHVIAVRDVLLRVVGILTCENDHDGTVLDWSEYGAEEKLVLASVYNNLGMQQFICGDRIDSVESFCNALALSGMISDDVLMDDDDNNNNNDDDAFIQVDGEDVFLVSAKHFIAPVTAEVVTTVFNLALAYEELDWERACALYEAIVDAPDIMYLDAYTRLAQVRAMHGQYDVALATVGRMTDDTKKLERVRKEGKQQQQVGLESVARLNNMARMLRLYIYLLMRESTKLRDEFKKGSFDEELGGLTHIGTRTLLSVICLHKLSEYEGRKLFGDSLSLTYGHGYRRRRDVKWYKDARKKYSNYGDIDARSAGYFQRILKYVVGALNHDYHDAYVADASANYCLMCDDVSAAFRIVRVALDVIGDNPSLYFTLGEVYFRGGHFKDATTMYEKGLSLYGSNDSGLRALSQSGAGKKQKRLTLEEQVKARLARVQSPTPNVVPLLFALARAYWCIRDVSHVDRVFELLDVACRVALVNCGLDDVYCETAADKTRGDADAATAANIAEERNLINEACGTPGIPLPDSTMTWKVQSQELYNVLYSFVAVAEHSADRDLSEVTRLLASPTLGLASEPVIVGYLNRVLLRLRLAVRRLSIIATKPPASVGDTAARHFAMASLHFRIPSDERNMEGGEEEGGADDGPDVMSSVAVDDREPKKKDRRREVGSGPATALASTQLLLQRAVEGQKAVVAIFQEKHREEKQNEMRIKENRERAERERIRLQRQVRERALAERQQEMARRQAEAEEKERQKEAEQRAEKEMAAEARSREQAEDGKRDGASSDDDKPRQRRKGTHTRTRTKADTNGAATSGGAGDDDAGDESEDTDALLSSDGSGPNSDGEPGEDASDKAKNDMVPVASDGKEDDDVEPLTTRQKKGKKPTKKKQEPVEDSIQNVPKVELADADDDSDDDLGALASSSDDDNDAPDNAPDDASDGGRGGRAGTSAKR